MIFQALYQFAKHHKSPDGTVLLDDLDHDVQEIRCVIRLASDGQLLGLVNENGRESPLVCEVSEIGARTSEAIAAIGGDTLNRIVPGFSPQEKERDRQTQRLFRRIMIQIARSTKDAGCEAVARFLASLHRNPVVREQVIRLLQERKCKHSDWATFTVSGVESETLCPAWPAVRNWWKRVCHSRRQRRKRTAEMAVCIVTKTLCAPMVTHGTDIKVAPGGRAGGVALVSADADAFSSYGFEKALASPMSEEAVKGYVRAINWLGNDRNNNYHYRTGYKEGDTIFLFWSDQPLEVRNPGKAIEYGSWEHFIADAAEPLPPSTTPIAARQTFTAPARGELDPSLAELAARYYCLSLSGAAARGIVRGWIDQPLKSARQSVDRWFQHLTVPLNQPSFQNGNLVAEAGTLWSRWPLASLLETLEGRGDNPAKEVAQRRQELWEAALTGRPIPLSVLSLACRRIPTDVFPKGKRKGEWREIRPERAALIQAALIRMNKRTNSMKTELNLDEQSVAFHCGRLLRLLQSIQTAALGDTNATIISRFYAGASSMPGSVFGTLLSKANQHLNKLRGDKPRLATWFDARIADVVSFIVGGGGFPKTNDPVAQGDFALGFYWQRLATRKEEPEAEPDEPEKEETSK